MSFKIDLDTIRERHARLNEVRTELLAHFVGIDNVIDDLIESMRVWYVMPEVLARPVIVNLWGMTGVGKTDLVRKLVKALNFQDRFAELEMSNTDQSVYYASVATMLESNQLNDTAPKILLFDELQRFNTIDHEGKPVGSTRYADFWELLSDGRIAKRGRENLDELIFNYKSALRENQRRQQSGEDIEVDGEIGMWAGRSLKYSLGLSEDIDDLSALSHTATLARIRQAKDRKIIYEPVNHAQSLILISGNLDDAFAMSTATGEADIDADIFHAFTRKISLVDIKQALSRRFKPEQVARFGNVHLIYGSLSKANYQTIIARDVDRVVRDTKTRFGIDLVIGEAVHDLIYRNGVFPAQGVRPVLSSVSDILESNLSRLLFKALTEGGARIEVDYDVERRMLVSRIGADVFETAYTGRLDTVRVQHSPDLIANISIHEAGHAVAYMAIFGVAPLQVTARVASVAAPSFMFPHEVIDTRSSMLDRVKVYLAGGLAEDEMFTESDATTGRGHDREMATQILLDHVRRYGFHPDFQASYTMEGSYYLERKITDSAVETLMRQLVADTRKLLSGHRPLLIALARRLEAAGALDAAEVAQCAEAHGLKVEIRPEGAKIAPNYADRLLKA
jgi:hypothetical protein